MEPTTVLAAPDSRRSDVRVGPEPPGVRPPRRLPQVVRALLPIPMMLIAALSPVLLVLVPNIDSWAATQPDGVMVAVVYVSNALATLMAVLLVWLAMRFVDRRPLREAGVTWNARSLPALLLGVVVTVVVTLAVGVATAAVTDLRPGDAQTGGYATWVVVLIWISQAFLLQGIPEELIWRGYLLQTLQTRPVVSVWISAALFAVCHLVSQGGQESALERLLYLPVPFGMGLLAGALVLRTGSVWSAVGVHGGVHLATMFGTLWFGVGEGPAVWVTIGVALTLVGLVVLRGVAGSRHPG